MDFARIIAHTNYLADREAYSFLRVWEKLSYPNRPTKKETEIYRKFIGGLNEGSKLLILGATPELRDLASELNIKPILVDISLNSLSGMLRFAKSADPRNEIWVKSDWAEAPLEENHFDAVVGDLSLRHIELERQELLFEKLLKLLKKGGALVVRHHVANPNYEKRSIAEILEEPLEISYLKNKYQAIGILLSRLFDAGTAKRYADHRNIIENVSEYLSKKPNVVFWYRRFLYDFLLTVRPLYDKPKLSQAKNEFEGKVEKYFSISKI